MLQRIPARPAACFLLALTVGLSYSASDVGSAPMLIPTPEASADADYNVGLHEKEAKRFPAAVASFRRAVEARPNFPEAWNELGFALRQTGNYEEALRAYDQALKLRPNFPEALEYLGEAYAILGRLGDARAVLERLRPLDAARAKELEDAIRAAR